MPIFLIYYNHNQGKENLDYDLQPLLKSIILKSNRHGGKKAI